MYVYVKATQDRERAPPPSENPAAAFFRRLLASLSLPFPPFPPNAFLPLPNTCRHRKGGEKERNSPKRCSEASLPPSPFRDTKTASIFGDLPSPSPLFHLSCSSPPPQPLWETPWPSFSPLSPRTYGKRKGEREEIGSFLLSCEDCGRNRRSTKKWGYDGWRRKRNYTLRGKPPPPPPRPVIRLFVWFRDRLASTSEGGQGGGGGGGRDDECALFLLPPRCGGDKLPIPPVHIHPAHPAHPSKTSPQKERGVGGWKRSIIFILAFGRACPVVISRWPRKKMVIQSCFFSFFGTSFFVCCIALREQARTDGPGGGQSIREAGPTVAASTHCDLRTRRGGMESSQPV